MDFSKTVKTQGQKTQQTGAQKKKNATRILKQCVYYI